MDIPPASLFLPNPLSYQIRNISFFFFCPQTEFFLAQFVPSLLPFFRILPNYFSSISYKLKFFSFIWSAVQNDAKVCLVSKQSYLYSNGAILSLCFPSAWIILEESPVIPHLPYALDPKDKLEPLLKSAGRHTFDLLSFYSCNLCSWASQVAEC